MTTPISRWANDAGFSLLELLVVLVIVGMMAALAIAYGPQRRSTVALGAAVDAVAIFTLAARDDALHAGRSLGIAATDRHAGLVRSDGATLDLPGFRVDVRPALPTRQDAIRFFDDGSSDGGRIIVSDAETSTGVRIDWLTGAVIAEAL